MSEKSLIDALKKIYTVNLGVRPDEKTLVFTDTITEAEEPDAVERGRREGLVKVARAARDAGMSLGLTVLYREYPALGSPGTEPEEEMWRLAFGDRAADELKSSGVLDVIRAKKAGGDDIARAREIVSRHRGGAVDAVIGLSNYSTSHTRFRDLLTSVARARYASMPLFEEDMLWGSMDVDWAEVERRSNAVAAALAGAESARVTTPAGTDITFSIKGRTPLTDTGMLTRPGSFSNLPAGEVYLAPVEGTAEGVLVLEWAPNRKLGSSLKVTVRGGYAREVEGDEPFAEELRANLARRPDNANLAELGIGTNDRASKPDNVLESEKILGTVHMAFGDNSSMGGKVSTPFHQDFVYYRPTLTVVIGGAEKKILDAGRQAI